MRDSVGMDFSQYLISIFNMTMNTLTGFCFVELVFRLSRILQHIDSQEKEIAMKRRVANAVTMELGIAEFDICTVLSIQRLSVLKHVGSVFFAMAGTFTIAILLVQAFFEGLIVFVIKDIISIFLVTLAVAVLQGQRFRRRDLGYCLAWGYYLGYLRLLLPKLTSGPTLLQVGDKKRPIVGLFLLVPMDCKVMAEVSDDDDVIEYIGGYVMHTETIAGIVNRQYKHSVYRIAGTNEESDFYCFLEYATPIKQLETMSFDSPNFQRQTRLSRAERDYQVNLFLVTLQQLLNNFASEVFNGIKGTSLTLKDFIQVVKIEDGCMHVADHIRKRRWGMMAHEMKTAESIKPTKKTGDLQVRNMQEIAHVMFLCTV